MAHQHDKDDAPVNGCDPEERYNEAFRDWLHELYDVLDFPDPEAPPAWVRELFESSGRVPPDRFAEIALKRHSTYIAEAFTRVAATVHTQTGIDLSAGNPYLTFEHPSDELPIGLVSFAGSPIWSADPPKMYVALAEAIQSYLADRYRKVWPLCPLHHLGTHPRVAAGQAVWWCYAGAHESERI
ncbi:hypothetical protein [Streptomyces sp. YIM 132580]|uniref:hypothetical protein n=1 Tax=Streptomyces sp. YIM 132580 TaxID=2691958 RepID=UPI001371656C|nr:hypothetical protein [Streptomyces sp. YIM 132580]MXG30354.1 hypothetical protein [Streptomyces sp. YIM 132580]